MPKPVRGFDSDWTLSQTAESKKTLLARCGEEKETPEKGKEETPSLEKGPPASEIVYELTSTRLKPKRTELFSPQLTPKEPD